MFSFSAIWFGLYRIYTFRVSYLFLMVVPHLRYMKAVFTSALLGLCLSKAPLNVALRNCWPFCWQALPFLLSPPSVSFCRASGSFKPIPFPATRTVGRLTPLRFPLSVTQQPRHREYHFSSQSPFPPYRYQA